MQKWHNIFIIVPALAGTALPGNMMALSRLGGTPSNLSVHIGSHVTEN